MPGSILARLQPKPAGGADAVGAPGPPARAPRRGWCWALLTAAAILLALGLLYARWGRDFQWNVFAASFLQLNWRWLAVSIVLGLLTYYGRALRWAVMLKPLRTHPSIWNLFSATAIGFTAVVLLGRAGEFVRPYLISVKERVPLSSQLAAWLLERICDLLAVLLVFGLALTQVRASRASVGPGLGWVLQTGGYFVGIISAVCLAVLILFRDFPEQVRQRLLGALSFLPLRHFQRAEEMVTAFLGGMAATRSHASVLLLIFYTLLEWVLIALCYFALFHAYAGLAGFRVQDILIFMGFVAFGNIVQIPGVGGGFQLMTVVVLTELFQVPPELATSLAITAWLITFIVIVPFGLFLSFREGVNWKKMRDLGRQVGTLK